MAKSDYYFSITVQVNCLDLLRKTGAIKGADYETVTKFYNAILRLKYVSEFWIDHMCFVIIDTETDNFLLAKKRMKSVMEKVERVFIRYSKIMI